LSFLKKKGFSSFWFNLIFRAFLKPNDITFSSLFFLAAGLNLQIVSREIASNHSTIFFQF